MSRRIDSGLALQSELVTASCIAAGLTAEDARKAIAPAVEHLQRQYGGSKLYIPKIGRKVSARDINRDFKVGLSQAAICRKYGISKRTCAALRDSK